MVDLHAHLLPEMDDGARSVGESVEILKRMKEKGVDQLALTSHYYPSRETISGFLTRRREAAIKLKNCYDSSVMPKLKLGAEVHYGIELEEADPQPLVLENTRFMLLELPYEYYPQGILTYVNNLIMRGIIPILAHVERFPTFRKEPDRLEELIEAGAYAQVTTAAILEKEDEGFCVAALKNGYAHILATDTHRMKHAEPSPQGLEKVLGEEVLEYARFNAKQIWQDQLPEAYPLKTIRKKWLGGYK